MEEKEPINARFTQWFEPYFTGYLLMYKEGITILLFYLKISLLGISDKKRPKMGLFFSYMPKRDLKLLVFPLSIRGMSL